jgi:hypothetical protein
MRQTLHVKFKEFDILSLDDEVIERILGVGHLFERLTSKEDGEYE